MSSKQITNILKILLFFSIGGIILFLLFRSQANAFAAQCTLDGIPQKDCSYTQKIISDFKSVNILWLIVITILYMASNLSRALRWKMMFRPMGYKIRTANSLSTLMFGYFANLGFPRLGEVLRPLLLSRYEKIKFEKVIGTIVAERALDMVMLLVCIAAALLFEFDTLWKFIVENQSIANKIMPIIKSPISYILIVVLFAASIFFIRGSYFRTSKVGQKLISLVVGFLEGIRSIFRLERPLLFILHTIFIWFMYYLMTRLCFYSFDATAHLSSLAGLMVFVFGTLGIVFPSPGGMGSYHALIMAGLAIYGVSNAEAFSFANIIFFTIQLFCNVLFGLSAYLLLPLMNKNYNGAISTQDSN